MIFALVSTMSLSRRSGMARKPSTPAELLWIQRSFAVGDQEVLDAAVAGDQAVAIARVEVLADAGQLEILVLVFQVREGVQEDRRRADGDSLGGGRSGQHGEKQRCEQDQGETRCTAVQHGWCLP